MTDAHKLELALGAMTREMKSWSALMGRKFLRPHAHRANYADLEILKALFVSQLLANI